MVFRSRTVKNKYFKKRVKLEKLERKHIFLRSRYNWYPRMDQIFLNNNLSSLRQHNLNSFGIYQHQEMHTFVNSRNSLFLQSLQNYYTFSGENFLFNTYLTKNSLHNCYFIVPVDSLSAFIKFNTLYLENYQKFLKFNMIDNFYYLVHFEIKNLNFMQFLDIFLNVIYTNSLFDTIIPLSRIFYIKLDFLFSILNALLHFTNFFCLFFEENNLTDNLLKEEEQNIEISNLFDPLTKSYDLTMLPEFENVVNEIISPISCHFLVDSRILSYYSTHHFIVDLQKIHNLSILFFQLFSHLEKRCQH